MVSEVFAEEGRSIYIYIYKREKLLNLSGFSRSQLPEIPCLLLDNAGIDRPAGGLAGVLDKFRLLSRYSRDLLRKIEVSHTCKCGEVNPSFNFVVSRIIYGFHSLGLQQFIHATLATVFGIGASFILSESYFRHTRHFLVF